MEEKFFTLNEVSKYLKIPRSTLYKLSQDGKIPSSKIGKQLRFRKSSLDIWLSQKEARFTHPTLKPSSLISPKIRPLSYKPKQVLLIDDDLLVLKTLSRFLQTQGYKVEPAQSGEEALKKIKNLKVDLVIADMRMPDISGIETIKRIREFSAKSHKPAIPEIIITGYMDSSAHRQAENLGITDYIYKPFAITEFIETVKKKLEPT